MKKQYLLSVSLLLAALLCVGCNRRNTSQQHDLKQSKIVVLLPGETGDLSWNDSNYQGILFCEEHLNIDIECITRVQESESEIILTEYAQKGYDLICATGAQFDEPVNTVAPDFPETTFCIINGEKCEYDNVALINPKEQEASYLAAVITGNLKEDTIGIIAGYPNASMEQLLAIYERKTKETAEKTGFHGKLP